MSVEVQQLTKIYEEQRAIDSLSFSVPAGEIVGLLGPNGAGKSTTMKILTGYIPQSEGVAKVCGFDVEEQSLEVRRRVGYLPEHNPLYKDLYVLEYLEFSARAYGISNKRSRIDELVEVTGLTRERRKKISQLSKGYRQRVGLAQALLHDPEVLILDEPTSGLDPNQLVDIRALIKELGQKKTVILSTHIMQEVQALCSRVLIINQGKLVADDPVDVLQRGGGKEIVLSVEFKEQVQESLLRGLNGVSEARSADAGSGRKWRLVIKGDGEKAREDVFRFAVDQGLTMLSSSLEERSLEDVFRQLTREGGGKSKKKKK